MYFKETFNAIIAYSLLPSTFPVIQELQPRIEMELIGIIYHESP